MWSCAEVGLTVWCEVRLKGGVVTIGFGDVMLTGDEFMSTGGDVIWSCDD